MSRRFFQRHYIELARWLHDLRDEEGHANVVTYLAKRLDAESGGRFKSDKFLRAAGVSEHSRALTRHNG